jgi:hypothetical protein
VRLYHAIERMPETWNVKPGTLDDTRWLVPQLHVWTSSRQPWVVVPEGVASFPRNPSRVG